VSGRTLLLGLDGATFRVLDPLMRDGAMPALRALTAAGARAVLESTVPALTPPAWTSMVTGRGPGAHGIFDFFRKPSAASLHFGLLTSRDVTAPSFWSMVSAAGKRSTVLNFPLTFPAPSIEGHVVPGGFMPWRQLRLGCHPPGLFDRLKELPRFNPRELALDMSEEAKALEGCADEEYLPWIDMHIRREQQWVDIARALAATEPADFTAVLFDGVDKIQHLCWRFIDPELAATLSTEWEHRVTAKCREYFSELDRRIGELVELMGEDATVVVTSDHGFGAQVRTVYLNAWLQHTGRLAWTEDRSGDPVPAGLGLSQMARHVYQMDWTQTRAYAPLPSGNGIHIVRADADRPGGVSEEDYQSFREALTADLLALTDPADGTPVISRVFPREAIFAGPNVELAPDLTLELTDGGLISILPSPEAVRRRAQPSGTHHPDGVFIASGPDLQTGTDIGRLSILDVAPLLAYSLDLPIPASMEGRLASEAFVAGAMTQRPPRHAVDVEVTTTTPTVAVPELDQEAETEILKRLQALGYVE
jgi:predicted AlkP superfamily phosphohydrolase/phosphomutase